MPLITVSYRLGCKGDLLARRVADGLKLELFDDARLQQEALDLGLHAEDLKCLDEKGPGWFQRLFTNMPDVYRDLTEAVVLAVSRKGNGVIVGHCSQMLLRDFNCALHVLVHASETSRIHYLMDHQGLSYDVALRLIHKADAEQDGFLQYTCQVQCLDPNRYDLVVNTDKLGETQAVRLVMDAARSREIGECSLLALEVMERRSLQKKIEASLLKHNIDLSTLNIEVTGDGSANISGLAATPEIEATIRQAVGSVAGLGKTEFEIAVFNVPFH